MPSYEQLRSEYAERWARMKITQDAAVTRIAERIMLRKERYVAASRLTGVPWYMIAAIHNRESSLDFSTQLSQGDPLNQVSKHVPANRGPFKSWEDGAYDALVALKHLDQVQGWPIERIAYEMERYNGWGYRNHNVPSAYLWSFSDVYKGGKYVADGVWSSSTWDKQSGTLPLVAKLAEIDRSITFDAIVEPPKQPDFFAAMRAHGFEPDTGPGQLNILYVEGLNLDYTTNSNRHNLWNDLRLVLDHTGKVIGRWPATVNPGDKYVHDRINPAGAANIAYGHYKAWKVGLHRGDHEALVQHAGPVTVDRDANEDFLREGDAKQTGFFGINQHWGYDLENVDAASAGCLVGQSKEGHREFMRLVKSDIRFDGKYVFSTTIMPASWLIVEPDAPPGGVSAAAGAVVAFAAVGAYVDYSWIVPSVVAGVIVAAAILWWVNRK